MRIANIPSNAGSAHTASPRGALIEVAAATIAKTLPTGWSKEASGSPDGAASLVIMSPDDAATTFLITGNGAGYQIELLKDDELWLVGKCNSVADLAWLLDTRIRLEHSVSRRAA